MKNKSVLIVERDPMEAEKIVAFLRKNEFRNKIDVVASKAEAMEYVFHIGRYASRSENETPGMILLDLLTDHTPQVGILRPLHLYLRTAQIPIIILTSSEEQEKIVSSMDLGAVGYVRKPFDFNRFIEVVQRMATFQTAKREPQS